MHNLSCNVHVSQFYNNQSFFLYRMSRWIHVYRCIHAEMRYRHRVGTVERNKRVGLAVFVHGPARKAIKKALIDSEVRYLNISLSHPTPKQGSLN